MDPRALLSCFAVAALPFAIWGYLPARLVEGAASRRIALGLLMGLGAIGSMFVPLSIKSGVICDLRGPAIAAAGFIGGPVSALIAVALALAYRLYLSGVGVACGCFTILSTAAIGVATRAIAARRDDRGVPTVLMAGAVSCAVLLSGGLLPADRQAEAMAGIVPGALMSFCGTCLFVFSLRRDERHRRLIARDALHRAIIEALPDSLTTKDPASRFIVANRSSANLMGAASPEDLIGKTDADFYPPEMAKIFRAEELTVLDNVVVGPIDQEITFVDGSRRWVTSMKTPLLDSKGAVVAIITHNRDVNDRKRLEAELLHAQSVLQEAMNNMADGLVLYDRDGVIRFCNRQYANMFPKTADLRVEGTRFADIIRASVMRGEEGPKPDLEAYVAERVRLLPSSGERLIELLDGRSIELRSRLLGEADTLIVFTDVTAKKQLERDLQRRASQDPLTGLANRAAFEFELDAAHRHAAERGGAYAVIMLDLDRFKPVNDTYGHAVGDQLLREVARRLRAAAQDGTLAARLGGDEFAFLVVGQEIETATVKLANRLVKSLNRPFTIESIELKPSGSAGIAYFPRNSADPFELLRLADKALYAVKTRGGGAWLATPVTIGDPRGATKTKPAAQTAA